jgi:hypothetical protein
MAVVRVLDPICKENGKAEKQFWSRFHSVAMLNKKNINVRADFAGSIDCAHAIILGEIKQFMLPTTAARAYRMATVIMLLRYSQSRWHKIGKLTPPTPNRTIGKIQTISRTSSATCCRITML